MYILKKMCTLTFRSCLFYFSLAVMLSLIGADVAFAVYDLPNDDTGCPENCRQIPWSAGSDQWNNGNLPNYISVTCSGLTEGDGTTNNASAIQTCINNAAPNTAVYIPAGIYYVNSTIKMKNDVVLRGAEASSPPFLPTADSTATTFKLGSSGAISFGSESRGTARSITSGYSKGSQTLVMASGHGFVQNDWIAVYETGDSNIPTTANGDIGNCSWCGENNGTNFIQQFVQVLSVSGNTITISRPLYYAYNASNSPSAKKMTFGVQRSGLENVRLDGSYANHSAFITMNGALFSWVKGVETYDAGSGSKASHINIQWSHGCEVRDSYFHHGRDSSSDRNYGIAFFFWNSDHKIENNILRHHRHSFSFEGGGAGCALLYNYVDDNYTDDTSYLGSARFNHGAHPMFNLFEGNAISHITADSYWGSSSHYVLFRNHLWGDETGTEVPGKPNWGFIPLDIWYNQNYYSVVGNILGITGKWGNPNWSNYTLRNSSCNGNPIYAYGCNSNGQYSSKAGSSSINHGNYDYKTQGVAYWEGGADHALKNSMYYKSKPSFFGDLAWPPYGPDLNPMIGKLPAIERYGGNIIISRPRPSPPVNLIVQ